MGNIDSNVSRKKQGSFESVSIMGCQPNRTREFHKLPDNLSLQHLKTYNKPSSIRQHKKLNENKSLDNSHNNNRAISIATVPPTTAPNNVVTLVKHRSLSPQFSDSGSHSTPQRELSTSLRQRHITVNFGNVQPQELHRRSTHQTVAMRRAKSFRITNNFSSRHRNASHRHPVCPLTGLTEKQKKLIIMTWQIMDGTVIRRITRNTFEALFKNNPKLLKFVGLEKFSNDNNSQRWKEHQCFRIHTQRFCDVLLEVLRTLYAPALSADRLLEFGAEYEINFKHHNCTNGITNQQKGDTNYCCLNKECPENNGCNDNDYEIPSSYWDALVSAFNNTIKEFQMEYNRTTSESPSCTNEPQRFLIQPSSSLSLSPTTLCNTDENSTNSTNNNNNNNNNNCFLYSSNENSRLISRNHYSSHSFNGCSSDRNQNSTHGFHSSATFSNGASNFLNADSISFCSKHSPNSSFKANGDSWSRRRFQNSISPLAVEAWNLLGIYVIGKIRFGYNIERMFQMQAKQLSKSIISLDIDEGVESAPENVGVESAPDSPQIFA